MAAIVTGALVSALVSLLVSVGPYVPYLLRRPERPAAEVVAAADSAQRGMLRTMVGR